MGAAIGSELLKTTHHRKRANRNPSRACPEQAHTQLDELCRSLPHTACTRIEVQSPKKNVCVKLGDSDMRSSEISPLVCATKVTHRVQQKTRAGYMRHGYPKKTLVWGGAFEQLVDRSICSTNRWIPVIWSYKNLYPWIWIWQEISYARSSRFESLA